MAKSVVGTNGPYHVLLRDTSSGATSVGMVLDTDDDGRPQVREGRTQPIPPRQSEGALDFSHQDPMVDFSFVMDDFSGGGLWSVWDTRHRNFYAQADGVDARWRNVVTLGMKLNEEGWLLRNAGMEEGDTDWDDLGSPTVSSDTSNAHTGSKSLKIVGIGSGTGIQQSLENPTVFRSSQVIFGMWAKRGATGTATCRLTAIDGVGANTVGTGVVMSTSYQYLTVTHTVNGSGSEVTVSLDASAAASSPTIYADDAVATLGSISGPFEMTEHSGSIYGIYGEMVLKFNETDDTWDAVYIHASSQTSSIVSYGANVYVGWRNPDQDYIYGANTSWTASGLSGDLAHATLFTVARDTLWKSRRDTTTGHTFINSSTNPVDGGSWGTEVSVGQPTTAITGLYAFNDTILVGKEDGLHVYNRVANDFAGAATWKNLTQQMARNPNSENFARGVEFKGWLYMTAAGQGLWRFDGSILEDISHLTFDPRQSDFGGKIRAITAGSTQLFFILDTPTATNTAGKEMWLISLREEGGKFLLHPLEKIGIGSAYGVAVQGDYVWVSGAQNNGAALQPRFYRWDMPEFVIAPAFDEGPLINTSGTIDLPRWHGGVPNIRKALIDCVIIGDDLDAEHTIAVALGVDGATPSTTTWGTLNANLDTLSRSDFSTPTTEAIGRDFQFRLTFSTDDTVSPKLYAIAFRFVLSPDIKRTWELLVWGGVPLRNGAPEGVWPSYSSSTSKIDKGSWLTNLASLESQVYPIQMLHDFDQNDDDSDHGSGNYVKVRDFSRVPFDLEDKRRGARPAGAELYRIILQEV